MLHEVLTDGRAEAGWTSLVVAEIFIAPWASSNMHSSAMLQLLTLGMHVGTYWIVGRAVTAVAGLCSAAAFRDVELRRGPSALSVFVTGYAATPLAVGAVAFALGIENLAVALGLVLALPAVAASAARYCQRRRAHRVDASDAGGNRAGTDGVDLLLDVPIPRYAWGLAIVAAVVACSSLLAWSMSLPAGGGRYYVGTSISDFEKHTLVTISLATSGFGLEAAQCPGVPLIYYTGFYVVPAAVARIVPQAVLQSMVAQWMVTAFLYVLLAYWLVSRVWRGSERGRLAGLVVMLSGFGLTVPRIALPTLERAVPTAWHLFAADFVQDGIVTLLVWIPQHMISVIMAICCLMTARQAMRGSATARVTWTVMSAFALASSTLVGLLYVAALAGGWMATIAAATVRRMRRTPAAGGGTGSFTWSLGLSLVAQGVLVLPHYGSIIAASLDNAAPTGLVFGATNDVTGNFIALLNSCGLGLCVLVAVPWFVRRGAVDVRLAMLLALALTVALSLRCAADLTRSDLQLKGLHVLQVALPLACTAVIASLWRHPARWMRRAGYAAAIAVSLNLTIAWTGEIDASTRRIREVPRRSAADHDLLRWVRENTRLRDRVTQFEAHRTTAQILLMRPAVASGPDIDSGTQSLVWHRAAAEDYIAKNRTRLTGLSSSEYLFIPNRSFFYYRSSTEPSVRPDRCREVAARLGFETVFENEAGIVARRPAGRTIADSDLPAPLDVKPYYVAKAAFASGDYPGTIRHLSEVDWPEMAYPGEAHFMMAESLIRTGGDASLALEHYDLAVANGYADFWTYFGRGQIHARNHARDKALHDLHMALAPWPGHGDCLALIAEVERAANADSTTLEAATRIEPLRR